MAKILESYEIVAHFVFLGAFIVNAIAWILFARISMARIEREMVKDGHGRPVSWDGIGFRIFWYANAIVFPLGRFNSAKNPLIDVLAIRQYAKPLDRKLGVALLISAAIFIACVFIYAWIFDLY